MSKPTDPEKQFWLLKTEPGEWSWEDQAANDGVTNWDDVKNRQAQKNLNDLCFFYHSGAKARRVVGVVAVVWEWYGEGVVDVKAVGEMRRPVDLKEMKEDVGLKGFALLRQSRLSVVPVPTEVWERVCEIGGGFNGDGKEELEEFGNGGDEDYFEVGYFGCHSELFGTEIHQWDGKLAMKNKKIRSKLGLIW